MKLTKDEKDLLNSILSDAQFIRESNEDSNDKNEIELIKSIKNKVNEK